MGDARIYTRQKCAFMLLGVFGGKLKKKDERGTSAFLDVGGPYQSEPSSGGRKRL